MNPSNARKKIAAIVPAYNEAQTIANVLSVLTKTKLLDEIIVVDDGSSDATSEEAKKFESVQVLRNNPNQGKGFSMERGVQATKADIIFFCDADLRELTPEIVEHIITPVLKGDYDMFIGIRHNKMQTAVPLFAINSGERALKRELWEKLPEAFKKGFRIEAGLNYAAKKYGKGFGKQEFPYYQTLKEEKYGFFRGTVLRWKMNFEVLYAYILALIGI